VVDRYRAGITIADALGLAADDGTGCAIHGVIEEAVLDLLDDAPERAAEAA
jgi:hypothetical protein